MKIVLMHQTVANHDAIGNDIELMTEIINPYYESYVYAQNQFNKRLSYIDREGLDEILQSPDNLVIYHHSVFWEEGEKLLQNARCKILFRYHNITPSSFFETYNEFHEAQCRLGREQTNRLVETMQTARWLCDSNFNAEDVTAVGKKRIDICPPFSKIEQWADKSPNNEIMRSLLGNDCLNLLFVGRIAPNKGHLFLLEVLRYYCANFDRNIKLWIIGKFDDGLAGYNHKIRAFIEQHKLEDQVQFIGEIDDGILLAYYLGSDLFVCASEHEGFCVPIIEAQYFQLPVVARAFTAVPFTAGRKQVILDGGPKQFAAAIRLLSQREDYRNYLRSVGSNNFQSRYAFACIKQQFVHVLNKMGVAL